MGWEKARKVSLHKHTGYFYEGKEILMTKTNLPAKSDNPDVGSELKIKAATTYAILRNVEQTSDIVRVQPWVIRVWLEEPWFHAIMARVRSERNEELDAKITEALSVVLDLILDRLRNGEKHLTKAGDVRQVPMKAVDAARIMEVVFNKRQLLRGEATTKTEVISRDKHLEDLKVKFERLAASKNINPANEVIDHEPSKSTTEGTAAGPESEGIQTGGEMRPNERQGLQEEVSETLTDYTIIPLP